VISFLSVDRVFVTILGYPMSYVELAGTLLYLASVWLIVKRNAWTWPVGIASVILYFLLFYQIRLYSDALEQLYYLGACVYGWWFWLRRGPREGARVAVRFSTPRGMLAAAGATAVLSLGLGRAMSRVHLWAPGLFPEPASYPYVDAATTVMSFTAMWLLARQRTEAWVYWILVDVVGIWLYSVKNVRFVALLYVLLLIMAVRGFVGWRRASSGRAEFETSRAG